MERTILSVVVKIGHMPLLIPRRKHILNGLDRDRHNLTLNPLHHGQDRRDNEKSQEKTKIERNRPSRQRTDLDKAKRRQILSFRSQGETYLVIVQVIGLIVKMKRKEGKSEPGLLHTCLPVFLS